MDLSNIPNIPFESNWSMKDENQLKNINNEYDNKKVKIAELEKELNSKYIELKQIYSQQKELINNKQNISKWQNTETQNIWGAFLQKWKEWDILCFIEYLKRMQYSEKSYSEYYSSDDLCMQQIQSYIKNKLNFEEQKNENNAITYFKGDVLLHFDESVINGIGITSNRDIQIVHESIQKLTKISQNDNILSENESKVDTNDISQKHQELKTWLTDIVNLPQYIDVFIENDLTLQIIKEIDRNILKEMNITSIGHQMLITKHAKQLKHRLDGDINEGVTETAYI